VFFKGINLASIATGEPEIKLSGDNSQLKQQMIIISTFLLSTA